MSLVDDPAAALADLRRAAGADAVSDRAEDIRQVLHDNSWLSPTLTEMLNARRAADGPTMGVLAVVAPSSEEAVLRTLEVAARHRLPLTPRGGGTSNWGLVAPVRGGLLLDLRSLVGEVRVEGTAVVAPAGTLLGSMEDEARLAGRELKVLPTTYRSCSVGGWVAGGHVGLGSGEHGAGWDGNVAGVRIATATDPSTTIELRGHDAEPLIHTFGTMGVMTEVALETAEAHEWVEAVASFPSYSLACAFVRAVSEDVSIHQRVVGANEAEVTATLRPIAEVVGPVPSVLLIVDAAKITEIEKLAASSSGHFHRWQPWGRTDRPSIAGMVYGHRLMWVKRSLPKAIFFHVYFDPDDPVRHTTAIKERFGDDVLLTLNYLRSGWVRAAWGHTPEGLLPAVTTVVRDAGQPGLVEGFLRACDELGIHVQNANTNILDDNGLYPDLSRLVRFKATVDPYNLLNSDKLRAAEVAQ